MSTISVNRVAKIGEFDPSVPVVFSVNTDEIAKVRDKYMSLTVNGVNDTKGMEACRKARTEVVRLRTSVERQRKEFKSAALEYGKSVDSAAKEIVALIDPVEQHLLAQEKIVKDEQDRIKREAEEARQRKIDERLEALTAVEAVMNPAVVAALDDEAFAELLTQKTEVFQQKKAEEARLEAERLQREKEEAERRRIENERLAAERAELDRQRKLLEEQQKKQREEQERLVAEQRQVELEKARKEAAEQAKRDAEEAARLKAEAAERKRLEEEAERVRQEALRPDREKLEEFAVMISEFPMPAFSDQVSIQLRASLRDYLMVAGSSIKKLAVHL